MRMQLAGWCVLLSVAGTALAADKPKKKEKPTTPPPGVVEVVKPTEAPKDSASQSNTERGNLAGAGIGSVAGALVGKATGNPKTGAVVGAIGGGVVGPLIGAEADKPAESGFTVTKPVGTWARDVNMGEANCRFTLKFTDSRLTLHIDVVSDRVMFNGRVDVDYSINKESVLFGVIDSCDVKSEKLEADALKQFAKFSGQPFAVRFRVEDDGLTVKDFKGLGVGLGEKEPELITAALLMMNGRFTKVDPKKPLPPLKAGKKPAYNSDPLLRQDQLLKQSESNGLPGGSGHIPPRPADPPSHLTPDRIHGGILKADPPKEDDGLRLSRVPLPSPHYLQHYPTYIAPEPAFPLQRERNVVLDPTGEIGPQFVTSAYVGSVSPAASQPAELVPERAKR